MVVEPRPVYKKVFVKYIINHPNSECGKKTFPDDVFLNHKKIFSRIKIFKHSFTDFRFFCPVTVYRKFGLKRGIK